MGQRGFHRGFTLIELSVVLVIIGLLVGGTLAGRTLIRAAELNSITSDIHRFATSINTFRIRYTQLPGDLTNAFNFWPGAGCTNATVADGFPDGCNGNGSGHVESWAEGFRLWQHLALAGMIEGQYTGKTTGPDIFNGQPGVNVPEAKVSNVGYTMMYIGTVNPGHPQWFAGNYAHSIFVGRFTSGSYTVGPFMSPYEMVAWDQKFDDGNPSEGVIRVWNAIWNPNCTTSPTTYSNVDTADACTPIFVPREF